MASKKLIRFFKGYLLLEISQKINTDKDEVCIWIKSKFNLQNKSCVEMENDELYEMIYFCFEFGDELGLNLNFNDNENDIIRDLL